MSYYRLANRDYLDWSTSFGFIGRADAIVMQLYCEPLQKFRLAAQGHGDVQPPAEHRARIERYFDPLPLWYPPVEEAAIDTAAYPVACRHPAADGDVPFLGIAECLAAADHRPQLALHVQ